MDYLKEILAFYDRLELNPLPSPAIALWYTLMAIANKTGWEQEFTVALSVLELRSGLNTKGVQRARNILRQEGLIEWASRKGSQSAVYRMNSIATGKRNHFVQQSAVVGQNDVENVQQSVQQPVQQSVQQPVQQSVHINKTKTETETILPPISPQQNFEDFWTAYPCKKNRHLAEQVYCSAISQGIPEGDLLECAKNYAEECRIKGTDKMYHAHNFLNNMVFEDYLPGKYKRPQKKAQNAKNSFHNFEQRDYDYDELMKRLGGHG